jgi:hypothetical protein
MENMEHHLFSLSYFERMVCRYGQKRYQVRLQFDIG